MTTQATLRRSLLPGGALAALFLLLLTGCAKTDPIPGTWQGNIQAGPVTLPLVVKITSTDKGDVPYAATLDSPSQKAVNIPVDSAAFTDGTLRLSVNAVRGAYEGKLSDDGKTLTGTWTQMGQSLPLVLTRSADKP